MESTRVVLAIDIVDKSRRENDERGRFHLRSSVVVWSFFLAKASPPTVSAGERDELGHVQPGESSNMLDMGSEVGGERKLLFLASGAGGSTCKMRWTSNVTLLVRGVTRVGLAIDIVGKSRRKRLEKQVPPAVGCRCLVLLCSRAHPGGPSIMLGMKPEAGGECRILFWLVKPKDALDR